jgi:acyl-CoA oxidase
VTTPLARCPRGRTLGPPGPAALPLLPLLYLAWADGDLEPGELEVLRERIGRATWLSKADRTWLRCWLDPADPPAPEDLLALRRTVRDLAAGAPGEARGSLSALGLELELRAAEGERSAWTTPEARAALDELWAELGLDLPAALAELEVAPPAPPPAPAEPVPTVSAARFADFLDGERSPHRRRVRELLAGVEWRTPPDLARAEYREWVLGRTRALADLGLGALGFPAPYGPGDLGGFISVFETLAIGDLSVLVKFGVQFGLWGGSVYRLGTAHHHAALLPGIASLELPGCFAMTELGHGSNVRDVETVARWDPARGGFVVHTPGPSARKEWIGNAALHGRMATVFAQLEVGGERHGVHALVVPLRDAAGALLPGVAAADSGAKVGLNGVDNGQLRFDHVFVPREALLDRFASVSAEGAYASPIASPGRRFFTMIGTLVGGRVSVAGSAVTAAKKGLAIAVRYGLGRRQFGPDQVEVPILDHLAHQRKLLPAVATAYALDVATGWLTRRYVAMTDADAREVEALAAGLKAWATRFAADGLQACREACGGEGYRWANAIGALRADTDVFTTFEGDNTVLLQLVAKDVLTGFRSQFGRQRVLRLAGYVARRAATELAEVNPVTTRLTDPDHLLGADFQLAAFRYREARLTASVARRLRGRMEGADGFAALNAVQDHLVALALAHVESVVAQRFAEAVEAVPAGPEREALDRVRSLFALSRLEADLRWFLEAGYVAPPKARAIRALVNRLCAELRPVARTLVDGFAIPDACLEAPIAVANDASTNFATPRPVAG